MFRIKNNKGFTMVELLATVTILGILATIATVSVTRTMQKAHKEYDQKQNKLFTTAAQTYFTDNRSALPKKLLTTSEVTLQELIDKNYIEEIVDYKKKAYKKDKSKAYVKKTGAGKYIYYSVLVGSDGREIKDNLENKKSDDITAKILGYDASESSRADAIDDVYYINNKLKIEIQLDGGISSYQYRINKLSSITATGKKYKTSGEIAVDKESFNDTLTIDVKDFANGIYQFEIYAYDYDGKESKSTTSKKFIIDKTKPKCEISILGTKGNKVENLEDVNWYKEDSLTVTMKITEQNKDRYTLGFNNMQNNITYENNNTKEEEEYLISQNIKNKKVYGYVIDKAGNEGKCETEKPIYYDNNPPECLWKRITDDPNAQENQFTNQPVTVELYCDSTSENNESGCSKSTAYWSQKYEGSGAISMDKGVHEEISDKAGNTTSCDGAYVNYDNLPPEIYSTTKIESSVSGYNSLVASFKLDVADYEASYINYDITVGAPSTKSYDELPYGPATPTISKTINVNVGGTYDGGIRKVYLTAEDAAHNRVSKAFDYKVYKACNSPPSNATTSCLGDWSSCSNQCDANTGRRTSTKTYSWTDSVANMSCYSFEANGCSEGCGGISYTIADDWEEDECSKNCGGGTMKKTRVVYQYGSEGGLCNQYTEKDTETCNTHSCEKTTCTAWSDCKASKNGYRKSKICTTTDSDGNKTTETKYKNCSHTHVWKARGTIIRTGSTWTCNLGHTSDIFYNVYCKLCGKKSEWPNPGNPTRACTRHPYTEKDGWSVFEGM